MITAKRFRGSPRVVIDFSQFLSQYGWLVLLVIVAAVAGGILYVRNPEGRSEWDRLCLTGLADWRFGAEI